MRASGFRPSSSAFFADISTTAAAPSFRPDAFAAVTEPSFENAGFRPASDSAVTPWRTNSSVLNTSGSPLRCGITTGTISASKRPAFCAASALFCDSAANASCSSRVMPYSFATFSAVTPMWYWL
ncbi:hypothetical protein LMG28688_07276 [Paraburkholderia caffeinitolerans]|uniref:Uncharacterized protein n=1 Tax=Paraburkholderia caffeinitolerans TaxID=1723730 RepID=A0A6J5H4X8_9BURK|nr:hypothetical protein LMG28688_07276 [Paraburkholderia caffeinitolerans]